MTKKFGRAIALDDFELDVSEGEVHGFLGPNGAGKSTTIRILLGLVRPSSGDVRVFGRDPWRDHVVTAREIGYVPGQVALWPNFTGGETIDLLLNLRGGGDRAERARLIDAFQLDPSKKARTYSTGNRQKVALIAAFARPSALYILDEPTAGLDPLMEAVFRDEVQRLRERGAMVLLSSHLLGEVEQLCDRVTIIRAGRRVETTSIRELMHASATRFTVEGIDAAAVVGLAGVANVSDDGESVSFEVLPDGLSGVLELLHRARVSSLVAHPPTLESIFMSHYETTTP